MPAIFVTATGTDIGKTYVTAGLARHWSNGGRKVSVLKPVMTGYEPEEAAGSDAGVLLRALGREVTEAEIACVSPWRYRAPLAPDTAAEREGKMLDFDAMIAFCRKAIDSAGDILLIEGVGGVMSPLDGTHTNLDWMVALNLPVVLVTGSYLGSISHALTALEVLEVSDLDIRALTVSETKGSAVPLADTLTSLERLGKGVEIATLARKGDAAADFAALAALIED